VGYSFEDMPGIDGWRWLEPAPLEWKPGVRQDHDTVPVRFYTFGELGVRAVYLHPDTYKPGRYCFGSDVRPMVEGGGGYVYPRKTAECPFHSGQSTIALHPNIICDYMSGAHFIPQYLRHCCTLGSKLPTGTPVFERGMNATGVFEDALFAPVNQ